MLVSQRNMDSKEEKSGSLFAEVSHARLRAEQQIPSCHFQLAQSVAVPRSDVDFARMFQHCAE